MGNKIKKLICALLASAMMISSVGIVSFADADTPTDEGGADVNVTATAAPEATDAAEATEAPEATAAPEATEAPVQTQAPAPVTPGVTNTAYDSDNYYQKALSLCNSLGIITGYEDGSIKPESNVTRAEMASIILRMLNMTATSKYQNAFTDVSSSHWAADQIQTAQEAGIISGMGDGTFVPDGDVTYAQVIVMLVNAMNYKDDAQYYTVAPGAHWATGYIQTAALSGLNLLKNAPGENDVASERGTVIKMVYNALLGDYKEISGYKDGYPVYKAEKTLAEAKFDLIEAKGVLMATAKTAVSGVEAQEGQIEIAKEGEGNEETKNITYDCALTGLEEYLAQKVTYYYKENSGLTPEVLAVTYDSSKTTTVTAQYDEIDEVTGFDTGYGEVKIDGVSKTKKCTGATVIYNGKAVTDSDLASVDINELLKPEIGTIKLVDSDKDDIFDVVFVDSYETFIITTASDDVVSGKVSDGATASDVSASRIGKITVDDKEDRVVTVTKNGAEVKPRNLKKNDVASVKRSLDETVIDIVVTGESITGAASSVSKKLDNTKATVNGTKYTVANIAADDVKVGSQSVFYLDMFGRIAYVEGGSGNLLGSGDKYGWIMNAYESESGSDYYVEIMTQDGEAVEYKLASTVSYWGPTDTESRSLKNSDASNRPKDVIDALVKGNSFIKAMSGTTEIAPIRLVKYKANSSNAITKLYCAVDSTKVSIDDDEALRIYPKCLKSPVAGSLVDGFSITEGMKEFSVPKAVDDMENSSNYKFGDLTNTGAYVIRGDSGSTRDYIVGEFTSAAAPTVLINFTASADALASIGDMDTNASLPIMVVESVDESADDEDNTVYTVNGYANGVETSFTTTKNTVLGIFDTSGDTINNDRDYNHKVKWNAKDGDVTGNGESFGDILSEGDMIMYDTGERILKMLDADDVYDVVANDNKSRPQNDGLLFGAFQPFSARNMFVFAGLKVTPDDVYVELDDFGIGVKATKGAGPVADSNLKSITVDSSKLMDTVEINIKSGKAAIDTKGSTLSDLQAFDDETNKGDYIFAKFVDKGTLQEMVVYRFVD